MEYVMAVLALALGYIIGRSIKSGVLDVEAKAFTQVAERIKESFTYRKIKLIKPKTVVTPEQEQLNQVEKELGTGPKE